MAHAHWSVHAKRIVAADANDASTLSAFSNLDPSLANDNCSQGDVLRLVAMHLPLFDNGLVD